MPATLSRRHLLAAFFAIAVATAGCARDTKPPTDAEPDVTIPESAPLALSRFNVPLQYDFTPILRTVERVVPKTFGSLDSIHTVNGDDRKRYAYEATRGPFTAWVRDSMVHLQATLSYAARGYYSPPIGPTLSAGCGNDDERPRIIVELMTPITLTDDWHLASKSAISRIAPASANDRDRCTVSIINYDVTDRVVDAARRALTSHLPAIDKKIGDVDLTNRFTDWWGTLNRPIRLADSVWLLLDPERLRLGEISGAQRTLTVEAGLDARPKIITGPRPERPVPPLPPLAHDTVSNGFYILMEGVVDYATASRGVTSALSGKSVTQAGHTVRVRTVTVRPTTRGRLALAVAFEGDVHGTLQFVGMPRYDERSAMIRVPDLDYDLDTDSQLLNAYAWVRSDALRDLFREKAEVPVAPVLDTAKALLHAGLNRKLGSAVTLSAAVDSVAVRGIYVTPSGVRVRAEATGAAGMAVKQK